MLLYKKIRCWGGYGKYQLDTNEIEQFRLQGYLGPYSLCSIDEMSQISSQIERVLNTDPPDHKNRVHNRHLDEQLIHQLSTGPQIVKRMTCLYARISSLRNPVPRKFHGIRTSTTGP